MTTRDGFLILDYGSFELKKNYPILDGFTKKTMLVIAELALERELQSAAIIYLKDKSWASTPQ